MFIIMGTKIHFFFEKTRYYALKKHKVIFIHFPHKAISIEFSGLGELSDCDSNEPGRRVPSLVLTVTSVRDKNSA